HGGPDRDRWEHRAALYHDSLDYYSGMRRPAWLDRESEAWLRDGLITADQRAAILNRYSALHERSAATVLTWLAVLTGGVGLVVLAGWNWDLIPPATKLGAAFGLPALAFAGAVLAGRSGRDIWARRLVFLGAVAAGGIFLAVTDIYLSPEPNLSVAWALALCVSAALVPTPFLTSTAGVVSMAWLLTQAGVPPPPWMFLALGTLLALAVEQAPDRTAGAVVTAAVAVWAFTVAADTWSNANPPLFVLALVAGAALDAWAHTPPERRPAFARPVPAAVFLLAPLAFLQMAQGPVRSDPWTDAVANPWPAIVLAVAFGAVAIWPAVSRRQSLRSAALAALGLIWLGAWLFHPASVGGPAARWPWTIAFSAATVLVGVSLVREASRERNSALFALGVLAILIFVMMRAMDAGGALWPSALALFAGAVLLAWLGRTWAKRS
ncbi:MAG TPA: DUF2157 domain-containing protein, partial [Vicinamibacterales bacterium]|nr:DUF2157 domain-containing protein [Vicinamibacterales bacterium]